MFLIKPNLTVSYILMFFSIITTIAQDSITQKSDDLINYKSLFIDGKIMYLPIYTGKNIKSSLQTYTSKTINTELETNWNTKFFNPFRNETLEYPITLNFDDKEYSSPVRHKMVITSRYGLRRRRPHQGIDIDLRVGDDVLSILDGKIRFVGYHGGHGKTIIVRHDNGLESVYAHLSKFLVKVNDEIKKGQVIGKGGITGNARGSHLHMEVRYHGKCINPEYLFEFSESTKIRSEVLLVTKNWTSPRMHRSTRQSKIILHKSIKDITDKEQTPQNKLYTVKKGDTLYAIANRYDLMVSEICKINSIQFNSILKIGQQIVLN